MGDRERRRAATAKDPDWQEVGTLIWVVRLWQSEMGDRERRRAVNGQGPRLAGVPQA
jgi:hypothetical protein